MYFFFKPYDERSQTSCEWKNLKESVVHLWNEGIEEVNANVVYENVWQPGDDKIFEMELKKLADYILDNNLYNKYQCTFADYIGQPYDEEMLTQTSCGAGKMLALSPGGKIYPCMIIINPDILSEMWTSELISKTINPDMLNR